MPKTKVLIKKENVSEEEKIIEPDLVVPVLLDEDTAEEPEESEVLDDDEVDPFRDKFEE